MRALADTTLDVARGELLCLIGPSGCGKSTLLNIIGGLLPPTSGSVEVSGRPLRGPLPREIAFVFQENALFPWNTVIENVRLGMLFQGVPKSEHAAPREEIARSRRPCRLRRSIIPASFPAACASARRWRGRSRLQTGILLMDEPFGALDEQTRMILGEDLSELLARTEQDHRVRHPQPRRGGLSRRPRRRVLGAAGHDQKDHPRRRAASAQAELRDVRRNSPRCATSSTRCCTTRSARRWRKRRRPATAPAEPRDGAPRRQSARARQPGGADRLSARSVRSLVSCDPLLGRQSPVAAEPDLGMAPAPRRAQERRLSARLARHRDRVRRRLRAGDDERHRRRLCRQPLALSDPRVRAAVRRYLLDPDHTVPAALCAVLRARTGIEDRARRHDQFLSHRARDHCGISAMSIPRSSPRHGRWAPRIISCFVMCCCPGPCR